MLNSPGLHQQQQIVLLYNSRKVVRMEAEYEEKTHVDLKVLEVEAQFDSTEFWSNKCILNFFGTPEKHYLDSIYSSMKRIYLEVLFFFEVTGTMSSLNFVWLQSQVALLTL